MESHGWLELAVRGQNSVQQAQYVHVLVVVLYDHVLATRIGVVLTEEHAAAYHKL